MMKKKTLDFDNTNLMHKYKQKFCVRVKKHWNLISDLGCLIPTLESEAFF